jgi:hypothetical protein
MNPTRQRKQSRDELRTMLLEAGRAIVLEEGIDTSATNLTFKRVFERIQDQQGVRLTNASVIRRVWENQADFQADVLVAVVADEARPELGVTADAIGAVFEGLDLSTSRHRAWALQEICRVGGLAASAAITTSAAWSLWISTVAIATSSDPAAERQRVHDALAEGFVIFAGYWEGPFSALLVRVGYRIREPWTNQQFTLSALSYLQGCSLRQRIDGDSDLVFRPTGRNGEEQAWALSSFGLEALVLHFSEPDPGFESPIH